MGLVEVGGSLTNVVGKPPQVGSRRPLEVGQRLPWAAPAARRHVGGGPMDPSGGGGGWGEEFIQDVVAEEING